MQFVPDSTQQVIAKLGSFLERSAQTRVEQRREALVSHLRVVYGDDFQSIGCVVGQVASSPKNGSISATIDECADFIVLGKLLPESLFAPVWATSVAHIT